MHDELRLTRLQQRKDVVLESRNKPDTRKLGILRRLELSDDTVRDTVHDTLCHQYHQRVATVCLSFPKPLLR